MTSESSIRRLLSEENRDPTEVAAALKFCLRMMRKLAHGKRNQIRLTALCRANGIDPASGEAIAV